VAPPSEAILLDQTAKKTLGVAGTFNAAALLGLQAGSLDRVRRVVRLNVFVNSSPGFTDQAKVANGASELLVAVFGDAGRHTRCAIGAAELPLNAPVELDLIVELER